MSGERESGAGREGPDGEDAKRIAGRRTLGPAPRPGSRYSVAVGLLFLVVSAIALVNTITTREGGVLGLEKETKDLPLAEFAVPLAAGGLEGDANIAQDDCSSGQLPCPQDSRRTPACDVDAAQAIRVCDYFDRPLVISFWFTRGGDCEAQQDVVSAVSQRYRGRVNFLSIDVRDSRNTVRDLIRERGWTMPVGYDHDGAVSDVYRVGGCPTFVFAYPGGILHEASIGELDPPALDRRVRELIRASRAKARTSR
ncbi:MAG: TlpA disulfide reductase family protein [Actinomycetota bacterium]